MSGLRIKQYREKNKYSQKDLAGILGVSTRTIARWEQNITQPGTEELSKVAKLIGVTEEELISDKDNPADFTLEKLQQSALERISDGVDNLVSGQDVINQSIDSGREEFRIRQEELIQELREQNVKLVKQIEENSKACDVQKQLLRQNRIRNAILIMAAILLIIIVIFFIWYTVNFGQITADPSKIYTD